MIKKLLTAIGVSAAFTAMAIPAMAQIGCGLGLPFGAYGCGFSCGFPWMGGLSVGYGLFGIGIPFWW